MLTLRQIEVIRAIMVTGPWAARRRRTRCRVRNRSDASAVWAHPAQL